MTNNFDKLSHTFKKKLQFRFTESFELHIKSSRQMERFYTDSVNTRTDLRVTVNLSSKRRTSYNESL